MDFGIISLILWIATILTFVFRNLWLRMQKLEKIAKEQAAFIEDAKATVANITQAFDTLDQENIFRANDYVGQLWLELKELNEVLKNYK